jgi:hypothetical protein
MSYYFLNEDDAKNPHTLPNVWVTHFSKEEIADITGDTTLDAGYMWCFCFPGCLPDSDWLGPFDSEQAALEDARQLYGD